MSSNHKLRFGIVGAGSIARAYAQAFEACDTARVTAVADVRIDAARALAERLDCPSFESHSAMARKVKLDAVVVCTPPVTHTSICVSLLEQKIHVLCEKPLAIDVKSARIMLD